MAVARQYVMHAAEGQEAVLESVLRTLAEVVRKMDGCEGVELMRDLGNERRFVFIERWASVEAHKEVGKQLSKELMGRLMATLDGPPDGSYLDPLVTV